MIKLDALKPRCNILAKGSGESKLFQGLLDKIFHVMRRFPSCSICYVFIIQFRTRELNVCMYINSNYNICILNYNNMSKHITL